MTAPERSLMLMKPSGAVPHVGGVLINPGEPRYELIRNWIAQGVKLDMNTSRVTKIEVTPAGSPKAGRPGCARKERSRRRRCSLMDYFDLPLSISTAPGTSNPLSYNGRRGGVTAAWRGA